MVNNTFKKYIIISTYILILFFALKNFSFIWETVCKILFLLTPFLYGFILAYLINWPYQFIESRFKKVTFFKKQLKFNKILSLVLAYIFFFGILIFTIMIIIPQLILSIQNLVSNSSHYFNLFEDTYRSILSKFNFGGWSLSDVVENFLAAQNESIPQSVFEKAFSFVKNFTLIIYNWTIGFVASIYFIFNKEKLLNQVKKILFVCLPNKYFENFKYLIKLSHNYFGKFIMGKLLDSLIIGILCFIGVSILKIPYAILISTIIGITNLIPFFGPFLGAFPCTLMLFVISPVNAVTFAIFIFILQQIDGNIIGPRILGSSIGISGLFIMFSVILGGGLFGVIGMLLGVPIFAVIYTIISNLIETKIKNKKV